MFIRLLMYMLVMIALLFVADGCQRSLYEASNLVNVRAVGGKAYALMQYIDPEAGSTGATFGVATPSNAGWSEWMSVLDNRVGPVNGLTALPGNLAGKNEWEPINGWDLLDTTPVAGYAESKIPASDRDRLLVMFDRRVSVYDPTQNPIVNFSEPVPFTWPAETAVVLNGKLYLFGAEPGADKKRYLRAAEYNGSRWKELDAIGPAVSVGARGWYYLQATNEGDHARIFWRKWEPDQTLGIFQEGEGPLESCTFDGQKFGAMTAANNLPAGNVSVFSDEGGVKLLLQSRAAAEEAITRNGPLQLWTVNPDGSVKLDETIEESRIKPGLLPFIFGEYLKLDGQEYILRSNTQLFEVWSRDPNGNWAALRKPSGLKTFDMETKMLMVIGVCMAMIAFAAGVAYRRRKIALTSARKIEAQELYATLGLRTGAYAVDLAIAVVAGYALALLAGSASNSVLGTLLPNTEFPIPYLPYFLAYMLYFTFCEWLAGATVGKMIMGLRVVMDGGAPLTFWAALVRNFTGFYERQILFAAIAASMIVFGPRRQRLGDIFARTFVVQHGALEMFKKQRAAELAQMRDQLATQSADALKPDEKKDGKQ